MGVLTWLSGNIRELEDKGWVGQGLGRIMGWVGVLKC